MSSPINRVQNGFSAISIFLVLLILGLLVAIVLPNVVGMKCYTKMDRVFVDFHSLTTALKIYNLDNSTYPSTDQGLAALVESPELAPIPANWHKYLDELPKDPWGNAYHYRSPGQHGHFDIFTLGADGIVGGEGADRDRGNWEELKLD